jgi:hypothetical protein
MKVAEGYLGMMVDMRVEGEDVREVLRVMTEVRGMDKG